MVAALLQSGGAWLPALEPERPLADVPALAAGGRRLLLDAAGAPLLALASGGEPTWLAVGPEGGMEPAERDLLLAAGFAAASLGERVLRFETAGVVGLGVLHARRAASVASGAAT
jgi:16S rRNA (uracil1498-N3)-methyltransferase